MLEAATQTKNFLSFNSSALRRGVWGEPQKIGRKFLGLPRERSERSEARQPFRSKKVRAKDTISPQIDTSRFERVAPRGREAAALRKIPRRFAANWLAGQKSKTADLSVSYLKTI